MGIYGNRLPLTGAVVLTVGGAQVTTPWIAAAGAALVIGGLLLVRWVRPARGHC